LKLTFFQYPQQSATLKEPIEFRESHREGARAMNAKIFTPAEPNVKSAHFFHFSFHGLFLNQYFKAFHGIHVNFQLTLLFIGIGLVP
jgi:hypothetical protein